MLSKTKTKEKLSYFSSIMCTTLKIKRKWSNITMFFNVLVFILISKNKSARKNRLIAPLFKDQNHEKQEIFFWFKRAIVLTWKMVKTKEK